MGEGGAQGEGIMAGSIVFTLTCDGSMYASCTPIECAFLAASVTIALRTTVEILTTCCEISYSFLDYTLIYHSSHPLR